MSLEITNVSLSRCTWKMFQGLQYLSFELLKHHAYYSRGYSWYWQDHKSIYELPLHQTLQRPMHLQKIQMTFIKFVAKVPTMVCFQHVRAILVIVYPHGGRRHQPKFEEPLTHSAVRAPSARLVACVRFMEEIRQKTERERVCVCVSV